MNLQTDVTTGRPPHDSPGSREPARMRMLIGAAAAIAVVGSVWILHSRSAEGSSAEAHAAALPQVSVAKPLVLDVSTRLGFLGQFSAVDQVELRAQVGGTLTAIDFKDGDIVQKGRLLFTIDSRPYDIKLAQAKARLETATSRLELADREFARARELQRNEAGTLENVEQRTADQRAAQAQVDDANAGIRDAQFDVEHCRIAAPFTGRIGAHLVSVGNLIAGSRAATSPTTLLATLVSLDPIHLDFDMSETDYQTFSQYRAQLKGTEIETVEFALGNDGTFARRGVLDFVNNMLDRSSGTIHARATVPNPGFRLTPGEFARLRLVVAPAAAALLVPDGVVIPDQDQHLVLTVGADGTVSAKQVVLGDIHDGLRVIRTGLEPDDRVIVEGLPFAAPGGKVATKDGTIRPVAKQS